MKKLMIILAFLFLAPIVAQAQKTSPMDFWNANHQEEENVTPLLQLAETLKEKIDEGKVDWKISKNKKEIEFIYFYYLFIQNETYIDSVVIKISRQRFYDMEITINYLTTYFIFDDEEKEIFENLIDYVTWLDQKGFSKNNLEILNKVSNILQETTKPH